MFFGMRAGKGRLLAPDHQMSGKPRIDAVLRYRFPMNVSNNAHVCDFGMECGVLVTRWKLKRIGRDGWTECEAPGGFEQWRGCHWFESANMILCLDDTGLGLLLTDHPLSLEGLEYARYRPRKVGRMLRWDRVYKYRHIIRRISTTPIPANRNAITGTFEGLIESECSEMAECVLRGSFDFGTSARIGRQRNRLRRFARSPFLVRSDEGGRFLDEADSYLDSFFANVDGESRFADRLLMFVVSAATVLALFSSSWGDYDGIRITLLIFSVPALFMLFLMSVPRRK